jgi:hypothetical protein
MPADQSVILEHLRGLIDRHGQPAVAGAIGVSQPMVSQVKSGKKPLSQGFREKLLSVYPLTDTQAKRVQIAAAPKMSTPAVAPAAPATNLEDERTWINVQRKDAIDLVAVAEAAFAELTEADWLLLRPEYQEVRRVLLETAPRAGLGDTLLPPPTEGAAQRIHDVRVDIEEIIAGSTRREAQIVDDDQSKLALAHSHLRQSLRRSLAKMTRQAPLDKLLRGRAWEFSKISIVAALKGDAATRARCVTALRALPGALAADLADAIDRVRDLVFPCVQYQQDPVGFIRRVCGGDPWEIIAPHWETQVPTRMGQTVIAESVRDHKWTVVHTGHKIGKTRLIAWLCLWWYCCYPDGHVMLANFTGKQLEDQDWFEIKQAWRESGICLDCKRAGVTTRPCPHSQVIDGTPKETSLGGLTSPDGSRFIRGATAREATGVGGYSGAHLLVIIDEFSGMSQELYDGWISNTSSKGSRFLGVGNPIGQDGPMYDAVMVDRVRRNFNVIHISSEEAAKTGIEGLADAGHIARVRDQDERGVDSPFYMVRVRGLYPTKDEQSTYQMGDIIRAQEPSIYAETPAEGTLIISLDPARPEGAGDKHVFAATRGKKVIEFKKGRGWNDDDCLEIFLEIAGRLRSHPGERVIFAIDADGPGAAIIKRAADYQDSRRVPEHEKQPFEIVPVYFGQVATKLYDYDLTGDEAHVHLARWLRHGGVFPTDHELEQEMQITKWYPVRRVRNERELEVFSATRKDGPNGYRKIIHRSPDTLDALRVFAYAAFMRDALDVPEPRAPNAIVDEEQAQTFTPIDDRSAFRNYLQAIRQGRLI